MNDESLFHLALEKPAAERPAFLEQACGGDGALRQRVEALLRSHETPDSFLIRSAENPELTTDSSSSPVADAEGPGGTDDGSTGRRSSAEGPGSRIGPYKLLQPIGEGGMGTVYMAEQTQPVRRMVALKVIKAGMDSRQVLARFECRAPGPGPDGPPEHRQGPRRRHDRHGPSLLRDGAGQGRPDHPVLRRAPADAPRATGAVHPGLPGRAARPPEGDHPPRPQAVQRPGRPLRRRAGAQGHRLRRGQGDRAEADRGRRSSPSSGRSSARWST